MSDQLTLDDVGVMNRGLAPTREQAKVARDEALVRVETHADDEWSEAAYLKLVEVAKCKQEFISDDIWAAGLESTREDRALGPVFRKAARNGICVKTDRTRPSVRSHLSGKPVWRSLVYEA